jgi:hypothetical protein
MSLEEVYQELCMILAETLVAQKRLVLQNRMLSEENESLKKKVSEGDQEGS